MPKPTQALSARDMALNVLLRVDRGDAVQAALDEVLTTAVVQHVDAREAALCTEMVYGYLRTALRVQAVLATVLRAPDKLPLPLLRVLGLSVHSLLFLSRVPAHAVLHWAVGVAQTKFGKKMGGVVNGALRSVQRLGEAPLQPDFYAAKGRSELEHLCLFYAMPLWVGELWRAAYGMQACEQLLRRAFTQPWACLRLNARHAQHDPLREEFMRAGATAVGSAGFAFAPGQQPREALGLSMAHWHAQGALSWQAAGSLQALEVGCGEQVRLAPHWGAPVWDACAGQGGKSLALLERGGHVALCSDTHFGRVRQLRATAQRLQIPCPSASLMQANRPALKRWDGTILLDVPCSGLGTLSRRPEIRARRTQQHVDELVQVQARMLQNVWRILQPGGHVVYMTCTLNPAENEQQVAHFLREQRDAREVVSWQTAHDHPWLEGMYVSVLRKW